MESKARLIDISKDWKSNKFRLTFELDSFLPNMADAIRDCCLRLSVKKWKEKRSLDSNAYMWVLLTKMAQLQETTADELYRQYIQYYGIADMDDCGHIVITVRARVDMDRIDGHWRFIKWSPDGKWKSYMKLKGTSQYDSGEMSALLRQIVEDAKDMGIETATPEELERMAVLYEQAFKKRAG